jgi:hypothetical protein
MQEKIKIYRGYLRNIGFSKLEMCDQREKILKKLEKKYWVEEKLTSRFPVKEDSVCLDHRDELTNSLEKDMIRAPIPLLKNGKPDKSKPKILLYWYIDPINGDGYQDLRYDLNPDDIVLTMDFTLPKEKLDDPQFKLIKESRSQMPSLFDLIRDLKRQKYSSRKISEQIKSRKGINMSHVTVNKIINENNWVL